MEEPGRLVYGVAKSWTRLSHFASLHFTSNRLKTKLVRNYTPRILYPIWCQADRGEAAHLLIVGRRETQDT